jgi:hypothetical protein
MKRLLAAVSIVMLSVAVSFAQNGQVVVGNYGNVSPIFTGTPTAPLNPNSSDSSLQVSTNAFVQNAINLSMATVPLSITGGTYSFDSQGTGALVIVGVSSGSVSSIITWSGGTNYAVGDLVTVGAGNFDAYIRITVAAGGVPTAGNIVYGGTGYTSFGGFSALPAISSIPYTFLLTGTLTSNVQFIMQHGTMQSQSNQWIFANNTTGAFSVNVCVAGVTDACSGGRTATPIQGTNNNTSLFVQTDGLLNLDIVGGGLINGKFAYVTSTVQTTAVLTSALPTCNAGAEGTRSGVTDALAPVALATVVGGGAIHVGVYCSGTAWIVQ